MVRATAVMLSAARAHAVLSSASTNSTNSSSCRLIPSDPSWPSEDDWNKLNSTISGRLITTQLQASVCHAPNVDDAACNALKAPIDWNGTPPYYQTRLGEIETQWDNATTYMNTPAQIMDPYYQNQTCDPFTPASQPCTFGNYPVYSIRVTKANDVIAGLNFAKDNNVRLSIHNTGHDYNGKSSGTGSLSLWTHTLKSMQLIASYNSTYYSGPAAKFGAGVQLGEAFLFASQSGYRVVTGECGTVGLAGGYSQGGGHGILNGAYGMASDNVLEWELVTGDGRHIIASPVRNSDIYWALSGGGGGTYGVVLSVKVKLHPDGPVTGPVLLWTSPEPENETYWQAVTSFHEHLPAIILNTSNSVQFTYWNNNFGALFVFLDGQNDTYINQTMAPLLADLNRIGQPYTLTTERAASYKDYYNTNYGPLPYGTEPPTTTLSSRIVPTWVFTNSTALDNLIQVGRSNVAENYWEVGCTASDFNRASHPKNAVLPAWRESIAACQPLTHWNFTDPLSANLKAKSDLANIYQPAWDNATPGSGVYLNEVDSWYQGDFKFNMYGSNYDQLLAIKHQYDPHNLFYGHFAVGSDEYSIDGDGRLCYEGAQAY